jgi:hypothetical protein
MTDMQLPERTRIMQAAGPAPATYEIVAPGFHSAGGFELLQREARAFTMSDMVPKQYRACDDDGVENPRALSNCVIAMNMALRMRADPLMVMQNLYIVHGTPAWSAKFLIGLFNTCGRFSAIRYAFNEKRDACFAHCRELSTGERIEGPSVTIAMAKAEGWMDRKGSKWRTMPEVMLTNRAAAFLIRTTAPELSLGLPMRDEAEDIVDIDAREVAAPPSPLQTVRDLLREPPKAEPESPSAARAESAVPEAEEPSATPPLGPAPGAPANEPAPPVTEPTPEGDPVMIEPKSLPVKDGELTPQDAKRRTRAAPPPATSHPMPPTFNVDVYARRIRAVADVDLLTLMREEISSLPPSMERDDLTAMIDARTRELIGNEGEDHDHA